MIYGFSLRRYVPMCLDCRRVAAAVAIPTIMALGACSSSTINADLASFNAWTVSLSADLATFNNALNTLTAATAPGLCQAASTLDTDFKIIAASGAISAQNVANEATAVQAVNVLCANTSTINLGTLAADAAGLYTIISAAQAAK